MLKQAPRANPRPMYVGIVLELETDTPKSRVGSVHAYESYVSLEFAQGTLLKGHLAALSDKTRLRRAGWSRSLSV